MASWRVAATTGAITQLATASAGGASHVAVVDVDSDMVATTCLTGSGTEKVISWRVTQPAPFP
jgi:hypothetical protein